MNLLMHLSFPEIIYLKKIHLSCYFIYLFNTWYKNVVFDSRSESVIADNLVVDLGLLDETLAVITDAVEPSV